MQAEPPHRHSSPAKHATEAKLLFLRIYNPKDSRKRRKKGHLKELFIKLGAVAVDAQSQLGVSCCRITLGGDLHEIKKT